VSPFQRIAGLTKWLRYLIIASVVLSAVTLVVQLCVRDRAQDFVDGIISLDDFEDRLGPFLLVGLVTGAISIAQLVVLCVWTFRLARNMQKLGRQGQSLSQPGVTVAINILGGCTLGILNFFMWREIWKGSDPECPSGDPTWKQRAVDGIVAVWLALTLGAALASTGIGIGQTLTGGIDTGGNTIDIAEQLTDDFAFSALSGLLTMGAAFAFFVLVTRLAGRHMQATAEA
jgi:hypothetical protein